ncbi:MAG: hypothetical protein HW402_1211 [Dehalococcoidales bacterium]|nr:hypothetical protein [Dehalococcoidales bacterium]
MISLGLVKHNHFKWTGRWSLRSLRSCSSGCTCSTGITLVSLGSNGSGCTCSTGITLVSLSSNGSGCTCSTDITFVSLGSNGSGCTGITLVSFSSNGSGCTCRTGSACITLGSLYPFFVPGNKCLRGADFVWAINYPQHSVILLDGTIDNIACRACHNSANTDGYRDYCNKQKY